ncbi:hypothetical protein QJS10_CPB19g00096 [Acorus calamus]|uniref:Uncharacterized protein n=1 Tax=Acorus calamus TaxID=4465 RepID=A0AAV9CJ01_ACOCL|nr:hypothetical protein QJS10_CPB19g00096 [Acorus calamus]
MNSKKGGSGRGRPSVTGAANSFKGTDNSGSGNNIPKLDQPTHNVADVDLDSDSAHDGNWEIAGKKNKKRSDGNKSWGSYDSVPRAQGRSEAQQRPSSLGIPSNNRTQNVDNRRPAGRGNARPPPPKSNSESNYPAPTLVVAPPLQRGWNWKARNGSNAPQQISPEGSMEKDNIDNEDEDADEDDILDDDDDFSDDYDSDVSQKSFQTRKKNRWLNSFFESLDDLTVDQINGSTRQWHCPACHNGPGAIDWYNGLQPLMTHAKTKRSKRVKLHRELASLLEEELHNRGTSVLPTSEAFGKWKGLHELMKDHEIVWPPMVVVMNTLLKRGENDKWLGMGNEELLEYFHMYPAVKARHSYGPHGHRGMSVLIFEASAIGYLESKRLHEHFAEQETDRDAWDRCRQLFLPGGNRQLYGYMATKEDLDIFNQHSQGKSRLKFDMVSYYEKVSGPMRQMGEDTQLLSFYKKSYAKEKLTSDILKADVGVLSQRLKETREENKFVRLRSKIQHEEHKEEMDAQESFFKNQLEKIHTSMEEKEQMLEKLLQDDRNAKQVDADSGSNEDRQLKEVEVAKFIEVQTKDIEEYETERDRIVEEYKNKKLKMRQRHLEEEVELEKKLNATLAQLVEKHVPKAPIDGGTDE